MEWGTFFAEHGMDLEDMAWQRVREKPMGWVHCKSALGLHGAGSLPPDVLQLINAFHKLNLCPCALLASPRFLEVGRIIRRVMTDRVRPPAGLPFKDDNMTPDEKHDLQAITAALLKFLSADWKQAKTEKKTAGIRHRLFVELIGEIGAAARRFEIRYLQAVHDYVQQELKRGKWPPDMSEYSSADRK